MHHPESPEGSRTCAQAAPAEFLTRTMDFAHPLLWSTDIMEEHDYEDNSPEDVLAVTVEMTERLDGTFVPSEEDIALQERYFRQFPPDHWAARIKTPIGRDFLRKHRAYFLEG